MSESSVLTAVRNPDADAIRDITPVTLAVAPLGFVVGVTILGLGIPPGIGHLSSPLLYSGSAQLTYLTLVAAGTGLPALVGGLLLVNVRLVVYSASLASYFRAQPAWFRLLGPAFIVDQTVAIVTDRDDLGDPVRFRRYWLTAAALLGAVWVTSIVAGWFLGPFVPDSLPLELAAPALFLGLLVPKLAHRRSVLAAAVAGGLAAVLHGPLGAASLPGAVVASLGLLALTGRRSPPPGDDAPGGRR